MQHAQRVARAETEQVDLPLNMRIPSVALERKRGLPSTLAMDLASLDKAVLRKYADRLVKANGDTYYLAAKRVVDIILAVTGLLLSLPLTLLISLLIKLDSPGPVLYRQKRVGKGGMKFRLYKFRTMYTNADMIKNSEEIQKQNKLKWPDFKIENDPRVTKVGRILRKYSLDEIPNFINVVLGEMSVVGPRPTSFHEDVYDEWHKLRLKAIPGITGLHQVRGRSDLEFDERVRLDIDYINRQSLSLDMRIILKTAFIVFKGKGAY